jgi:hypothetical protein
MASDDGPAAVRRGAPAGARREDAAVRERLPELAEADARGTAAAVYGDLRAVYGLPFVNLIWRHLAAEPGRLERIWADVRPAIADTAAPRVLLRVAAHAVAERPVVLAPGVRDAATAARATLDAYDRGNALNVVALSALLEPPRRPRASSGEPWPPLRGGPLLPMLATAAVKADDRPALDELTERLAGSERPLLVPGLLRHLAARPGLLAALADAVRPALHDGLASPANVVVEAARAVVSELPHAPPRVQDAALRVVLERFVRTIARMLAFTALARRALGLPTV